MKQFVSILAVANFAFTAINLIAGDFILAGLCLATGIFALIYPWDC